MVPWNVAGVYGSSDHLINLGGIYRSLQALFAYCRDIVSMIGDPDIKIIEILDHPYWITN